MKKFALTFLITGFLCSTALAQGRGGIGGGPPGGGFGPAPFGFGPRVSVGPAAGPPGGFSAGPPGNVGGIGGGEIGGGGLSSLPAAADNRVGASTKSPPGLSLHDTVETARDSVGRPNAPAVIAQNLALDERGQTIVRGEVLVVSPTQSSLAIARRLNLTVERRDSLGWLGLTTATLRAPVGMSAVEALAALRRADPRGVYDYAHIYNPSGDVAPSAPTPRPNLAPTGSGTGIRVGMIDGGVDRAHPAFRNADLIARGFAGNAETPPTAHGTAVASLLVGRASAFSGYIPGAVLYAADVFGGAADGGSADDVARALNWLAANHIAVTNISLAGPPNLLLAAAVKAFVASGHVLVAAAGNGGPAAPPSYPATYPGVIAVTSVDSAGHLEVDASRGDAQFAALGVGVRAATLPQGYAGVTGTSYAAPLITSRFARLLPAPNPTNAKKALDELTERAPPLDAKPHAPRYLNAFFDVTPRRYTAERRIR